MVHPHKLLAATAVAATVALLGTACTGSTKGGSNDDPEADVDITFWHGWSAPSEVKAIQENIDRFEADHPNIHVKVVGNITDDKINQALRAGGDNAPDVVSSFTTDNVGAFCDSNVFVDLAPFLDESGIDPEATFPKALLDYTQFEGDRCTLPLLSDAYGLYYNKDAFKEAGLDPAKPPANWDEMAAMGQKLVKKSGGQVERWGVMVPSTGYPYWMFQAFAMQNGEVLMNSEGNETYFDKPAVVEALTYWQKLGKDGTMPAGAIEWGTLRQNFVEGKTAMMWHTTGNLSAVKKEAKFDFGVAMLPAKKRFGSPTGGGNFYIFKQTTPEERKAAMRLIKFMTAPEMAAKWSIATGYMGVSPASYETEVLKKYAADFPPAAVALDQLKYGTAELSTYQTGRVRKALNDAIQAVLTGAKEPAVALKEAQSQADRLLKPYGEQSEEWTDDGLTPTAPPYPPPQGGGGRETISNRSPLDGRRVRAGVGRRRFVSLASHAVPQSTSTPSTAGCC